MRFSTIFIIVSIFIVIALSVKADNCTNATYQNLTIVKTINPGQFKSYIEYADNYYCMANITCESCNCNDTSSVCSLDRYLDYDDFNDDLEYHYESGACDIEITLDEDEFKDEFCGQYTQGNVTKEFNWQYNNGKLTIEILGEFKRDINVTEIKAGTMDIWVPESIIYDTRCDEVYLHNINLTFEKCQKYWPILRESGDYIDLLTRKYDTSQTRIMEYQERLTRAEVEAAEYKDNAQKYMQIRDEYDSLRTHKFRTENISQDLIICNAEKLRLDKANDTAETINYMAIALFLMAFGGCLFLGFKLQSLRPRMLKPPI